MQRRFLTQCLAIGALLLLVLSADAGAQQRDTSRIRGNMPDTARVRRLLEERFGRGFSNEELLERLRTSGLTRSQVRTRLQQLGYDPGLADEYFDIIERGGDEMTGEASREFVEALARVGLATPGFPDLLSDTAFMDSLLIDSLAVDSMEVDSMGRRREIEVFGLEFFRQARRGSLFEPVATGPVDPGYRLGPGDQVTLVLTGDVEDAYDLQVSREGLIFIPAVGQVSVNGLTLAQLEQVLFARLGRVYSGISPGPEATTRFAVSIGRLRSNQVFITGDVATPGAYQVAASGTVFNALYRAGGPSESGSFRNVQVSRASGETVTVDLYDYLVYGDGRSDVRIEHNDRIFVPPAGPQVRIEGSVKRPAIYEIRNGEGLRAALAFAGGLEADAVVSRIQVDRILPPEEREPGLVRVLRDVDLRQLYQTEDEVALQDGDVVRVFAVSADVRNRVWLTGEVRNPGTYEWFPGITLDNVLARAEGVTERAYAPRIHIYRLNEQDNTRTLVRVPLNGDNGSAAVPLVDRDSVVVLSREDLVNAQTVTIEGYVKEPGEYTLAQGMTLKDLILAARGFEFGAYVLEAEVSRIPNPLQRTDTTAQIVRIPLDAPSAVFENGGDTGVPVWAPDSAEFPLRHGDRVFIRKAPGFDEPREIMLTGQVLLPGRYMLETREERIADLITRAGGLTDQAYPAGMHVVRAGRVVAADLHRALDNPDDRNNILLEAGDSVHVPAFDPTVVVTGAVNFEARVLHRPGAGLSYYINQAGGYTDNADKGAVTVAYKNGERSAVSNFPLFGRTPKIEPGSEIFVPAKPEGETGFNWDTFLTRTLTVLSTGATLIIAISQIR